MLRADNLTTFLCRMSRNLGVSSYWNLLASNRPVKGLLFCFIWVCYENERLYLEYEALNSVLHGKSFFIFKLFCFLSFLLGRIYCSALFSYLCWPNLLFITAIFGHVSVLHCVCNISTGVSKH